MRRILAVWLILFGVSPCLALAGQLPPAANSSAAPDAQASSSEGLVTSAQGAPPPATTTGTAASAISGARQGVGFTAGLVSGLGFAYRRHFANNFGMQIGGIAWENQTESFVSLGGEMIRTVSRSDRTRLYWVVGTSVLRNTGPEFDYSDCYPPAQSGQVFVPCVPVETRRTTGSVNIGAGIGLEFTGTHIGLSLEVPLSLMLDLDERHRFERKGIYPIPSASLIYYF